MDSLEKILLLEILVDSVYYEKTAIDPDILPHLLDTNVKFQFLDFPPIDIGEADFCRTGDLQDNSEVAFKSGKSILFALPDTSRTMGNSFDLDVSVSRKIPVAKKVGSEKSPVQTEERLQEGVHFKLHELGKTVIKLGESFINLLEATSYEGVCPTSKTVRDSYQFWNASGALIGYVTVFIRLSCFGKIIVTQFQADLLEDKPFCFRGGDDEGNPEGASDADHYQPSMMGGYGPAPMAAPQMYPPMGPQMFPPMPQQMFPPTIKVAARLKKKPKTSNTCGKVPSELLSSDSEGGKGPYCVKKNCPNHYPPPSWAEFGRKRKDKFVSPPVGGAAFHGDDVLFQMSDPLNPNLRANKENITFKVQHEPGQQLQDVQMVSPDYQMELDKDNDIFLLKFSKRDDNNQPAKLIISMKTPKVTPIDQKCICEKVSQTDEAQSNQPDYFTTTKLATALGKAPAKKDVGHD